MENVRKYLTIWLLIASAVVVVPEASALNNNAFNIKYSASTTYRFVYPPNPVTYLNLSTTGNVGAGSIPVSVEVLMDTSTQVKPSAPGVVFKNVNILVGTGDFAEEKKIEQALIGFRVDNSWLESNGIAAGEVKMVRWDGTKWSALKTEPKEKDGIFTYFEAETSNFSPFAITAMKAMTEAKPGGFLVGFKVLVFAAMAAVGSIFILILYSLYRFLGEDIYLFNTQIHSGDDQDG